jgi:hypothetical protein
MKKISMSRIIFSAVFDTLKALSFLLGRGTFALSED